MTDFEETIKTIFGLFVAIFIIVAVISGLYGEAIASWWAKWGILVVISIILIADTFAYFWLDLYIDNEYIRILILTIISLVVFGAIYGWIITGIGILVTIIIFILFYYYVYKQDSDKTEYEKVDSARYKPTQTQEHQKENEFNHILSTIEPQIQNELDSILSTIKERFKPELVRDEEDFEKQLFQFLKILYPNRVKRQWWFGKERVDITIDYNKFGLELKIAENRGILRNLIGQITIYKEIFEDVAIILLDVGCLSKQEIYEFIERYNNMGVKTLVIKGFLKRKKIRYKG